MLFADFRFVGRRVLYFALGRLDPRLGGRGRLQVDQPGGERTSGLNGAGQKDCNPVHIGTPFFATRKIKLPAGYVRTWPVAKAPGPASSSFVDCRRSENREERILGLTDFDAAPAKRTGHTVCGPWFACLLNPAGDQPSWRLRGKQRRYRRCFHPIWLVALALRCEPPRPAVKPGIVAMCRIDGRWLRDLFSIYSTRGR